MATLTSLETRYRDVMDRVGEAAARAGRSPNNMLVVAVSKYAEVNQIRELIELGHRDFGESRVQQLEQRAAIVGELMERRRTMPGVGRDEGPGPLFPTADSAEEDAAADPADRPVRWHMIGSLQRNKARKCVEQARLIHSVDSLRLVDEVHAVAFKQDREVDLLVQVNTTGEKQKSGCAVAAVRHLCDQVDALVHVNVRGLMTMGPTSMDEDETRFAFMRCRELFEELRADNVGEGRFNILSMGMSNDFELAIECGANCLRIGSAIFGDTSGDDADEDND